MYRGYTVCWQQLTNGVYVIKMVQALDNRDDKQGYSDRLIKLIQQIRSDLGVSFRQLAKEIGIERENIYGVIHGRYSLTSHQTGLLVGFLNSRDRLDLYLGMIRPCETPESEAQKLASLQSSLSTQLYRRSKRRK